MIKESLLYEVRKEQAKEAIKAVETIVAYCQLTTCSTCPFVKDGKCYLFSDDVEVPSDWYLEDLKMD